MKIQIPSLGKGDAYIQSNNVLEFLVYLASRDLMLYMNKSESGYIFYSENVLNNEELIHLILNDIQYEYFIKCKNTNGKRYK